MIESLKKFLKKITTKPAIVGAPSDPNCRIINGSFQVSQCTIDEKLKINGEAILGQNTIVKKTISVNGQLKATGTLLEDDLFTNGTTNISHSSLKRKAYFSGNLTARNCQFSDSITLHAHNASFIHCQISHLIFQELPYIKTPQKLRLSNGCDITGDITFEAGSGEVWIEKSSLIHGKVHGGKIIYT